MRLFLGLRLPERFLRRVRLFRRLRPPAIKKGEGDGEGAVAEQPHAIIHCTDILFDIDVRQHYASTTHVVKLQCVHHFRFGSRGVLHVFVVIDHFRHGLTLFHFLLTYLLNVVPVLVGQHVATCHTFNWDDHL